MSAADLVAVRHSSETIVGDKGENVLTNRLKNPEHPGAGQAVRLQADYRW